jgi:hypothetical protein
MQFLIGGLSYFKNRLGFPSQMALPEWIARKNVAFTCDMLDGSLCDTFENVAAVVQTFVDFRSHYRRPVDPQQWGTRTQDDPTYSYEDQYVGLMATPPGGGGSFGGTKWEFVGGPGQSYAPLSQKSMTDTGARAVDQLRIDSMTRGFALPRLYSWIPTEFVIAFSVRNQHKYVCATISRITNADYRTAIIDGCRRF